MAEIRVAMVGESGTSSPQVSQHGGDVSELTATCQALFDQANFSGEVCYAMHDRTSDARIMTYTTGGLTFVVAASPETSGDAVRRYCAELIEIALNAHADGDYDAIDRWNDTHMASPGSCRGKAAVLTSARRVSFEDPQGCFDEATGGDGSGGSISGASGRFGAAISKIRSPFTDGANNIFDRIEDAFPRDPDEFTFKQWAKDLPEDLKTLDEDRVKEYGRRLWYIARRIRWEMLLCHIVSFFCVYFCTCVLCAACLVGVLLCSFLLFIVVVISTGYFPSLAFVIENT